MSSAQGRGGALLIWGAVLVFAAANSLISLLNDLGTAHPVDGRNPISFCNVLFVGNLCASLTLYGIYRKDWNRKTLAGLSKGDWGSLLVLAVLSGALAPALVFLAIENTTVMNVVIMGRLEPILVVMLSAILLSDRADRWTILGMALSLIGVGIAFVLQSNGEMALSLGKGEWQAAAAAVVIAFSAIFSKLRMKHVPLGIFAVFKTGVGVVVFFVVAVYLFGFGHFIDVFSPFLWQTMMVYGAVVVVGGQLLWIHGLRRVKASDLTLPISFAPVAGIGFAFLIVGEVPSVPILIGGAVIVTGIVIAQSGKWMVARRENARPLDLAVESEGRVGFKGV